MREARNVCQSTKRVKLSLGGPIHPKSIVLGNRENKKQLITDFSTCMPTDFSTCMP